jgi:hypothetical protein
MMKTSKPMQNSPPNIDFTDLFPSNVNWEFVWKMSRLLIGAPHFYTVLIVGFTYKVLYNFILF